MKETVNIWQEEIAIPTYLTGKQDVHPMFLERRVYQGASGSVYPYGVIDMLTDEKVIQCYQALYLENDYLKIMLLPELGGRIQRAYDKVKQRDFVYHNDVIKPALVGLLGPWISGGIEFNWPQHHRPTTYMPVDFDIQSHDNGAKTVWVGEIEPMQGLQVMTGFTLYPDRALVEISSKVYNSNPTPRNFLWWANPAVKGGDDHQSVFPPDVTAVFDHGKRDVSAFPIATGTYYKVDYSAGVDISRYKNVPVPTSYMADKSDYDFVGAYSHDEQGGLLHIADHHISPGKKQWSWGNCEFGIAWDRNLTDDNGPYIELMTGIFTDNQPDFTWLDAYEEKCFVQNFMPYNTLGTVQNANTQAVLKLEKQAQQIEWGVYAVIPLKACRLTIVTDETNESILTKIINLEPGQALLETIKVSANKRLRITLLDESSKIILSYLEHIPQTIELPSVAEAPAQASEIMSSDEAYFIGQHLEQYHHANRSPFDYYLRGLELDKRDYRCNLALATLEYNRADYPLAIDYASHALERSHRLNKNPQCGLASLIRGCAYEQLGQYDLAYEDFFRSVWSGNSKAGGYLGLARIATRRMDYQLALNFCESSLDSGRNNYMAIALKALLLKFRDQHTAAEEWVAEQLHRHPLHYTLHYLRYHFSRCESDLQHLRQLTGGRGINALTIAHDMLAFNQHDLAIEALKLVDSQETLPVYMLAYLQKHKLNDADFKALLQKAQLAFPLHVRFPNTLAEVNMLTQLPESYFAQHLLACFYYSKCSYKKAVALWRHCTDIAPDFADAWRSLGIYYWNKRGEHHQATTYLAKAFSLNPHDARLLFELDLANKLANVELSERYALLASHLSVVEQRDDLVAELLSLYNHLNKLEQATDILAKRHFHPWEGGEGKITGQYILNLQLQAFNYFAQADIKQAQHALQSALHFPENLGEGRLIVQTDNDLYFLLALCAECNNEDTSELLDRALIGNQEVTAKRYYNDQPVDYLFYQGLALIRLGQPDKASELFINMINWAEQASKEQVETDFFAVSLPDLVVLDSHPQQIHQEHCQFVKALGLLGQGHLAEGKQLLNALLKANPAHDKAYLFLTMLEKLSTLIWKDMTKHH